MNHYPPIQQFRIWSPEEKKFSYSGGTPMMLSRFFEQTAILDTVHQMPYQRDTFLKDKNGREIYEGDVIEREAGSLRQRYVVEIPSIFTTPNVYPERSEIIGNIYENPELLTV